MGMEQVVDAPSIFKPLHNLLDSANRRSGGDGRWENGVAFNPEGCLEVHAHDIDCPPGNKSPYQDCPGVVKFTPFIVELGVTVPSTRHPDFKAVMQRQLDVSASSVIERTIWTGVVPANDAGGTGDLPHKLDGAPAVDAVIPATTDAISAVGALEAALLGDLNPGTPTAATLTAGARAGGVMHMSPIEAVKVERLLIKRDGNLYTKTTGAKVIIGNYPSGKIIAHAGEIDYWLSSDFSFFTEDDFKKNEFPTRVEAVALVIWNPCKVYEAATA